MESTSNYLPSPAMAVDELFKERNDFILVGLTGRTGSGCTTVSKLLEKKFEQLNLPAPINKDFQNPEQRDYRTIYHYAKEHWKPFTTISMSAVITMFVLEEGASALLDFIKENTSIQNKDAFSLVYNSKLQTKLNQALISDIQKFKEYDSIYIKDNYYKLISIYERTAKFWDEEFAPFLKSYSFPKFNGTPANKNEYINLYSFLFQIFGNNIRRKGRAFGLYNDDKVHMYDLAIRTNAIIKSYRNRNRDLYTQTRNENDYTHICIDAIRSPYEATFFKDRYAAFYLVSVKTEEEERIRRLMSPDIALDTNEIKTLDQTEYPSSLKKLDTFTKQDIAACIQLSDIHLTNHYYPSDVRNNPALISDVIRYVTLMMHPGLITPTNIERCMQVAFNAKLSSGCLSRQVGAVITNADYSIKAVGWNDAASGQIPCNQRDAQSLCAYHDRSSHSKFELEDSGFFKFMCDKFESIKYEKLKGRLCPYCFNELYNQYKGQKKTEEIINNAISTIPLVNLDGDTKEALMQRLEIEFSENYVKNQVYVRSLHAEENAFLQITKYGGQGIEGGYLFVTASPCELCSKKSYQLGIKRIYYIDPYPGIAKEHIIAFGSNPERNPDMEIFSGAIGKAYTALYSPPMPFKDELVAILDDQREVDR